MPDTRQQDYRRRARQFGVEVESTPTAMLMFLTQANCFYCGGEGGSIDHFNPLSRGGAAAAHNVVPVCARCNGRKGARSPVVFLLNVWGGRTRLPRPPSHRLS